MQEEIKEQDQTKEKSEQKLEAKIEESKPKYISIDDFLKVEIKLGTVVSVTEMEGSDKLYRLVVDFNELDVEGNKKHRNVFSGIKKYVTPDELIGKQFPFVVNLEPRKMMGEYSEAMILAASAEDTFALLTPTNTLPNGTQLR